MDSRKSDLKSPKIGRPVIGQPKTNDVKVRIDDETHNKLISYCKEKNITKAEAIRLAIAEFLS